LDSVFFMGGLLIIASGRGAPRFTPLPIHPPRAGYSGPDNELGPALPPKVAGGEPGKIFTGDRRDSFIVGLPIVRRPSLQDVESGMECARSVGLESLLPGRL
jgi:hypothetical protein